MELRRTVLVAHPVERIYHVIEAAEEYPAFLPWCAGATILERSPDVVTARLEVAWHGVHFGFVTRNPKRPPHWMAIGLEHGPFRRFQGEWNLTPLSDWGCRVEFWLTYEFATSLLGRLAAPVFDRATNALVDAFLRRADQLAANGAAPRPPPAATASPTPAFRPTAHPAAAPAAAGTASGAAPPGDNTGSPMPGRLDPIPGPGAGAPAPTRKPQDDDPDV